MYNLVHEYNPPIVGADTTLSISFDNQAVHARHAFIVDRYKRSHKDYIFYYKFIPDDANLADLYGEESIFDYSTPTQTYFGMNWGFGGLYDSAWCVSTGGWQMGGLTYERRLQLLHFGPQEEPDPDPDPED